MNYTSESRNYDTQKIKPLIGLFEKGGIAINTILDKLLIDQRNNLYELKEIHIEEEDKMGRVLATNLGVESEMEYEPKLEMCIVK